MKLLIQQNCSLTDRDTVVNAPIHAVTCSCVLCQDWIKRQMPARDFTSHTEAINAANQPLPVASSASEGLESDALPIGPLIVEPCQWDHGASIVICHRERGIVAKIEPINADDDPDMDTARREPWDQAYANLFAAAPDLLEALKAAFSDLNLYWRDDFLNRGLAITIQNAIAKAEGRL